MADYQVALERIERELDAGNADLATLGFWRVVGEAKRDPDLTAPVPEWIGRIDRKAFESRKSFLFPVWLGNLLLLVGTLVLLAAVVEGLRLADPWIHVEPVPELAMLIESGPPTSRPALGGLLVLAAAVGLSVTVHAPAHWLAGRMVGIRFTHYFLDGPFRIQPGIKTDYASYLRTPAAKRASMHAAGALASKAAPFIVFGWAYVVHWQRGWELLPEWSLWAVLGFGLLQIATDIVWSTRRSDWKKVRRELRIAREIEGPGVVR